MSFNIAMVTGAAHVTWSRLEGAACFLCEQTEGLKLARVSETTRTYRTVLHNINVAHKLFLLKGHKQEVPVKIKCHTLCFNNASCSCLARRTSGPARGQRREQAPQAEPGLMVLLVQPCGANLSVPSLSEATAPPTGRALNAPNACTNAGGREEEHIQVLLQAPSDPYVPTAKRLQDGENIQVAAK